MKTIKFLFLALALTVSAGASAQLATFYQPLGTNLTTDTVTNTATAYVTTRVLANRQVVSTTIQIVVTKISGTVGGTITLQGSIDGTNFKALNTPNTQTAMATITAADATAIYHYWLAGCPYQYYRVSWTGTGTMSATVAAKLYRN